MISFISLPAFIQSAIGLYFVLLFSFSVVIICSEAMNRHWKGIMLLGPLSFCLYAGMQFIFDYFSNTYIDGELKGVEEWFLRLPWFVPIVILVIFSIIEVRMVRMNRRWIREHITAMSIKEAVDNLPIGICCYEPNGEIILKNHRIEKICRAYTGKALLNAALFLKEMTASGVKTDKGTLIHLKSGEVFTFLDRPLTEKGSKLRMLSIVDISEQYQSTKTLEEKQQEVSKLNEELVLYGKQVIESITAREILEAKVKIHDELGTNLLASKRYILSGGSAEERNTIEAILRRNIQYLKQESKYVPNDEYAVILDAANKLDIKLNVSGALPETDPLRHIVVTGIHECLTNTIRHARGDELTVVIDETDQTITARYTNNGMAPDKEIEERGGLALLRSLVEKNGGCMMIDSTPRFRLTLQLNKQI